MSHLLLALIKSCRFSLGVASALRPFPQRPDGRLPIGSLSPPAPQLSHPRATAFRPKGVRTASSQFFWMVPRRRRRWCAQHARMGQFAPSGRTSSVGVGECLDDVQRVLGTRRDSGLGRVDRWKVSVLCQGVGFAG
jgi:hypothetical protein